MKQNTYFKFGRHLAMVTGIITVMQFMTLQPAHADAGWVNTIFQPLMSQVVGPAMEKGIDAWQAKHTKTAATQTVDVPPEVQSAPMSTTTTGTTTTPSTSSTAPVSSAIQWDGAFNKN